MINASYLLQMIAEKGWKITIEYYHQMNEYIITAGKELNNKQYKIARKILREEAYEEKWISTLLEIITAIEDFETRGEI